LLPLGHGKQKKSNQAFFLGGNETQTGARRHGHARSKARLFAARVKSRELRFDGKGRGGREEGGGPSKREVERSYNQMRLRAKNRPKFQGTLGGGKGKYPRGENCGMGVGTTLKDTTMCTEEFTRM